MPVPSICAQAACKILYLQNSLQSDLSASRCNCISPMHHMRIKLKVPSGEDVEDVCPMIRSKEDDGRQVKDI